MSATTNSTPSSMPHDAEVGLEGGERVVGDLGLGRRDAGDQRALADVGEPDEGDVGQELELEPEPALLAHLALLGEGRRPAPVGQEPGVAPAALAAGAPPASGRRRGRGRPAPSPSRVEHDGALGHGHDRGRRPGGRGASCPGRGCRSRPAGAGGRGRPAARRRCGRPRARRRRRCRRRRRRARPWATWASRRNDTQPGAAVAPSDVQAALVDELAHRGRSLRTAARPTPSTRCTGSPLMAADHVVVSAGEPLGLRAEVVADLPPAERAASRCSGS